MRYSERTELKIKVAAGSGNKGANRRFQANVEPNHVIEGENLIERLADYAFGGNKPTAANAVRGIEEFIIHELENGNRIDFSLATFYPRLSAALSARDADPAEDGITVRGAVKAKTRLVGAPREKVVAVNTAAKDVIRIFSTYNPKTKEFDVIRPYEPIRVTHQASYIIEGREDEGFILEKRTGKGGRKPKFIAKAEIIGEDRGFPLIVFKEDIPRGKYNLVVLTRSGKSTDYALRRIGHPVSIK